MTSPPVFDTATPIRKLAIGGGFVLLYVMAELAARPHAGDAFQQRPWSAALAMSLALLVHLGPGWMPLVGIAALSSALIGGTAVAHPGLALSHALAVACACGLSAYVLRPRGGGRVELDRVRAVGAFLGAIALAAALIALEEAVSSTTTGVHATADPILSFVRRFVAAAVAMAMLTPLLLQNANPITWSTRRPWMTLEVMMQVAALGLIAWEVFWRFVNEEIHFFYLMFLPIGWIATRHGLRGTVVALGAIYLAPLLSDWVVPHSEQAVIELQIRLGMLAVTGLILAATVEERRRSESRMIARQTELAHVQRLNVGWEMASALAHELNQPLTAAMNYAQAAQRLIAAPNADLDRAARMIDKSLDQTERVGQVIHGLRDFLKKGELQLGRCEIADIVEDALRLVAGEANAAGVRLETRDLSALPAVMADRTQIGQVLINLLRNAIQALEANGTRDGKVIISGRLAGDRLQITVADNGPGLEPDVLARLFEPFVTTKTTGMGLGLSISKSILEAHHGNLWVDQLASGGTACHIALPLAPQGPNDA